MSGSCNLALLTLQQREQIAADRAAFLVRAKASQLASSIFAMKRTPTWRAEAERLLKANPGLEAEARKALNRMTKK